MNSMRFFSELGKSHSFKSCVVTHFEDNQLDGENCGPEVCQPPNFSTKSVMMRMKPCFPPRLHIPRVPTLPSSESARSPLRVSHISPKMSQNQEGHYIVCHIIDIIC